MADNNRKSNRSFDLQKGPKRTFDLSKTSARKFNLSKDSPGEINLDELKKELLADGQIDAAEVKKLQEVLYADGKIDREEADFLFELNDAVSGKQNDPSWKAFFVQAISDYLLKDEKSTGVIDEDEGRWLASKIGGDGQVDEVEKSLLGNLKKEAKSMPASVAALAAGSVATSETDEPSKGNGKKWAAVIAALALLGGGGYAVSNFIGSNGENEETTEELAQNETNKTSVEENVPESLNQDAAETENATDVADTGNGASIISTSPSEGAIATDDGMKSGMSPDKSAASGVSGTQNSGGSQSNASGDQSNVHGQSSGHQTASNTNNTNIKQGSGQQQSNNGPTGSSTKATVNSNKAGQPGSSHSTTQQPANPSSKSTTNNVTSSVSKTAPAVTEDVNEMAWKVIRGDFGNGLERKRLLGDKYRAIQRRVNQLYRKGRVK